MATPEKAIASLRREVTVEWPKATEANARALLVRTAKEGHKKIMVEQMSRYGVAPDWEAFGDIKGRPVEQAQRIVVYKYSYFREIIIAVLQALRAASPVDSGRYRNSHMLYVDGHPADINTPIRGGQEVMITNPVPYARRLEVGRTKEGRALLISKPNHIYERVAKGVVGPRYRNSAKLTFGYTTLPDAHIVKGGLTSHFAIGMGKRGKMLHRSRRQVLGSEVRQPAIYIGRL